MWQEIKFSFSMWLCSSLLGLYRNPNSLMNSTVCASWSNRGKTENISGLWEQEWTSILMFLPQEDDSNHHKFAKNILFLRRTLVSGNTYTIHNNMLCHFMCICDHVVLFWFSAVIMNANRAYTSLEWVHTTKIQKQYWRCFRILLHRTSRP